MNGLPKPRPMAQRAAPTRGEAQMRRPGGAGRRSPAVPAGRIVFGPAVAAILVAIPLAACSVANTPDRLEIANMYPWNVVPKSSPGALVRSFERYCLDGPGSAAALDAPLRRAGYVPMPAQAGRPRTYLVDDRRPAVLVSDSGCMVAAESRTGQTERARRAVAERFPAARPVPPQRVGRNVEDAWLLPAPDGRVVFTLRQIEGSAHSRYGLGMTWPGNEDSRKG